MAGNTNDGVRPQLRASRAAVTVSLAEVYALRANFSTELKVIVDQERYLILLA